MLKLDDEVRLDVISTNSSQVVDMCVPFGNGLMRLFLITCQLFYPSK
jgi:hypothetical protein